MYRLCVGYVTEEKSSEGVNKEDNESNKHPCAGAQKSKLSKPQAGIFINNKNNLDSTMETMRDNKHPCAGAQRSKLSKPQAGIFINNENNYIQQWRQ